MVNTYRWMERGEIFFLYFFTIIIPFFLFILSVPLLMFFRWKLTFLFCVVFFLLLRVLCISPTLPRFFLLLCLFNCYWQANSVCESLLFFLLGHSFQNLVSFYVCWPSSLLDQCEGLLILGSTPASRGYGTSLKSKKENPK